MITNFTVPGPFVAQLPHILTWEETLCFLLGRKFGLVVSSIVWMWWIQSCRT